MLVISQSVEKKVSAQEVLILEKRMDYGLFLLGFQLLPKSILINPNSFLSKKSCTIIGKPMVEIFILDMIMKKSIFKQLILLWNIFKISSNIGTHCLMPVMQIYLITLTLLTILLLKIKELGLYLKMAQELSSGYLVIIKFIYILLFKRNWICWSHY